MNRVEIGYIRKAQGLKGEVLLRLYDGDASFLHPGEELWVEAEPMVLKSLRPHKLDYIASFEKVCSRNQSENLKGKKLFISSDLFEKHENKDEVFLSRLLGFQVFNHSEKKGVVCGFSSTKAHELIQVELEDNSVVEVPWVEAFTEKVEMDLGEIFLVCPEDLFDFVFFKG